MSTQVTAVRLTASGQVTLEPTRVRAFSAVGNASAGTITLIDGSTNGSGGVTRLVVDFSAAAGGLNYAELPELGIKFNTNVYCTITGAPFGVTIFYG